MLGPAPSVEDIRDEVKQYGFPVVADYVDVNGGNAAQLYKTMKDVKGISTVQLKKVDWNYEKFLLDRDGVPVRRYRPGVPAAQIAPDVEGLVSKGILPKRVRASLGAD
jgi:glutathione peroxidase-family protein